MIDENYIQETFEVVPNLRYACCCMNCFYSTSICDFLMYCKMYSRYLPLTVVCSSYLPVVGEVGSYLSSKG